MKKLLRHLKSDKEDEEEAIVSYGKRQKEAKDLPKFKSVLKHIQSEEKDHKSKLKKMISTGPSKEFAHKMIRKYSGRKS